MLIGAPYRYRPHIRTVKNGGLEAPVLIKTLNTFASRISLPYSEAPRSLVMPPRSAREWILQIVGEEKAEEIITDGNEPTDKFIWLAVLRAAANLQNQGALLIKKHSTTPWLLLPEFYAAIWLHTTDR